jgi:hypothetical protein
MQAFIDAAKASGKHLPWAMDADRDAEGSWAADDVLAFAED